MAVYFECDYNELPFEEVIRLIYGEHLRYSSYAKTCYKKHKYIFKSCCGTIYGTERTNEDTIKLTLALNTIYIGGL